MFLFLIVCLICIYLLCLFVCFDKVVTLALIFLTKKRKWSQLKARGRNALNAQNKEVYKCIILQESWLKACHFSDIDECARNLSCHVNANCTNTLDHMYVHATLDTLETDKLAQVILITFLQCREKSFMTEERQPPLLLFLHIQSQLLKAGGNLKRLF